MRYVILAAMLAIGAVPAVSFAQTPAPAPTSTAAGTHYTTEDTDLGTLLDDPAAKAILVKHIPEVVSSEQIDMGRSLTLRAMQSYAADKLTDKALADIDADLAKLPAK